MNNLKIIYFVMLFYGINLSSVPAHGQLIQGKLPSYEALINPKAEFKSKWEHPWIFEVLDDLLSKERAKRVKALRFLYNNFTLNKDKPAENYKHQLAEVIDEKTKLKINPYLTFIHNASSKNASIEHKIYTRLILENIMDLLGSEANLEATLYLQMLLNAQAPFDAMNWRIVWPQTKAYQSLIPPIYLSTPLDPQSESSEKTPPTSSPIVPSK